MTMIDRECVDCTGPFQRGSGAFDAVRGTREKVSGLVSGHLPLWLVYRATWGLSLASEPCGVAGCTLGAAGGGRMACGIEAKPYRLPVFGGREPRVAAGAATRGYGRVPLQGTCASGVVREGELAVGRTRCCDAQVGKPMPPARRGVGPGRARLVTTNARSIAVVGQLLTSPASAPARSPAGRVPGVARGTAVAGGCGGACRRGCAPRAGARSSLFARRPIV
jgi:hypothetical protein